MELKDYLRIIKRRWLTVALVAGAFLLISSYYMKLQPVDYVASVEIALKESPYPTFGGEFPALFQDYLTRATKIAMIKSRKVLEIAITKHLQQYYPDVASAMAKQTSGNGQSPASDEAWENMINTYVKGLRDSLVVAQDKETELVTIAISDRNPQRAVDIVNAVAMAFEERSSKTAVEGIENAVSFIDKVVESRDKEIEASQKSLSALPSLPTTSPIEIDVKRSLDRMQKLQEEKDKRELELGATDGQISSLAMLLSDGAIASNATFDGNQPSSQLRNDIKTKERELDDLLRKYTESSPQVKEAKAKIVRLKHELGGELESEKRYRELSEKLRAFDASATLSAKRKELSMQVAKLTEQVSIEEKSYQALLKKPATNERQEYQELLSSRTQIESHLTYLKESRSALVHQKYQLWINKNLIDKPVERLSLARDASPKSRAGSSSFPFLLLVSMIIGVGCAYILEYMNTTVRTEHDVKRYVNLPVIGGIARIKDVDQRLLLNVAPKSPIFEVFNTIGTILETYANENNAKTFMVVSSKAEEGKSTVSTNIAVALAKSGEKVIMIDCDLRKAILHRFFNIDNSVGLSSYVLNSMGNSYSEEKPEFPARITLDDVIKSTEVEGLRVIPAGPHPKNPVALLKSDAYKNMLTQVREKADIVLIDVPPVNIAVDTLILSPLVDAVILLISAGETNKDEVTFAKRMLESAKGRMIGCILNKVTIESRGYYYYYYYDRYRYYRET